MKRFSNLLFILLAVIPCSASTIIVDWDGTGDYLTIQAGINDANDFDTVIVAPGTYYENINFSGKNIILTSTNPDDPNTVADTVMNGSNSGSVVVFSGTEDPNCLLTGFTIAMGYAEGSGIVEYGGGINGYNTEATIANCVIADNYARSDGGGLAFCDGLITGCIIDDNVGHNYGGGLYYCDGAITNCTISNNTALGGEGGGLAFCDGLISGCTVTGNTSGYESGGLYYCDGMIRNCKITNNNGNGLQGCDGPVVNCIITNNTGSGLYYCDGSITNSTIVNNTNNGLYECNGPIANCIIRGNSTAQMLNSSTPTYSCIQEWVGGGVGNFDSDPLFAFDDCYQLMPGSPCIDAGDNTTVPVEVITDFGGYLRFYDDPNTIDTGNPATPGDPIVDIGAYEYNGPRIAISPLSFKFIARYGYPAPAGRYY